MSVPTSDSNSSLPNSNGSQTVAFNGEQFSKEERDVAFAVRVINDGLVSERQLRTALTHWTIHGATSVADQLQTLGLLSRDDRDRCEAAAAGVLSDLHSELLSGGAGETNTLSSTLQRLDGSGRVAKVLGISDAGNLGPGGLRSSVARLTLVRKLGQGGLGTVWLARDENLQRYVALKEVTRTDDAGGPAIARFRREAEITGRLEHPGIVPVYELGEDRETDRVFYTMRFLGKQTFQNAVQEYHERRESGDHDPMLLRNLLTAFVSICQAIGHAHSRKVIHRDLKPENVAIDNFGQVIVIDWGLAKVLDETHLPEHLSDVGPGRDADSQLTAAGQVFGTPLYMAPEQAAGRLDEVDERTDVYGLGAILFAILTGNAPHERSQLDAGNSGVRALITAIASKPTPLAREVNADVDPALEAICAKGMAKRRYARYQSATEFAEEVQRWMAGEPVKAYREKRSQRVGRWVQQHRRTSQALATALTVALVAGVIMVTTSYQNRGAARKARFEQMKGTAREIDVQFTSNANHLANNARFMSNVPPVYGILAARAAPPNSSAESEEIWRPRLELIYEGLMRVNRDYLAVAYMSMETGTVQEIVRVERHTTDPSSLRRVPKNRLARRKEDAFFHAVRALNPGEVRLAIIDPQADGGGRNWTRPRMLAAVPVYDEMRGNIFGMVVIETDAVAEAEGILNHHNGGDAEIFVTDGHGQVWVSSRPGRGVKIESTTANVAAFVPRAAEFFNPDNAEPALVMPEGGVIANRIRLDSQDPGSGIGVVLRLAD